MMHDDLVGRLLASPPLSLRVDDRIYWMTAPQDAEYPRITLTVISGMLEQSYGGPQALQQSRIQFDIWALSYADANETADVLVPAALPAATFNGTRFRRSMVERATDFFERGPTQQIFRKSIDLMIWHSAA